jgi:regulatory associated protein of mTOR
MAGEAYLTIDAHRGSLTALAVHRHAPVIVSGSAKQLVKVFSLQGEQLSIIRYYPTFMAQRIGSVTCLSFHPYRYFYTWVSLQELCFVVQALD